MLTLAGEGGVKVSFSITKDERGALLIGSSNDYRTRRVIQGRSKTFDCLNGKSRKLFRQTLLESDFVKCVQSMRIELSHSHAFVCLKKVSEEKIAPIFQLSGMFFCPVDPLISSGKSD